MSSIITAGITPAMIPGIRKAIEVCEEYAEENIRIARDDIHRVCSGSGPSPTTSEDLAVAFSHGDKMNAGKDIARLLRAMVNEGDAA